MSQRRGRILVRVIVAITTLVGGGVAADAAPAVPSVSSCLSITNAERKKVHKPALRVSALVTRAAVSHSKYQAGRDRMSHTGARGSNPGDRLRAVGYKYRTWGENVAAGYGDCKSVMSAWMHSSGHRQNILNGSFTEIGIAVARAKDGTLYWTMDLARPR